MLFGFSCKCGNGSGLAFSTYAAALAGGDLTGTVLFQNPVSNPGGSPPVLDQTMTGMPALVMTVAAVPEPGTLAIAGLGAVLLLAFRRRS
jgi:hypothetical protein